MVCNEKSTISDPESSKGNDTPASGFFVAYHLVRQGTVGAGWKLWVRKGLSRRQIRVGSLSTALHLSGNSPSSGQDRQTDRKKTRFFSTKGRFAWQTSLPTYHNLLHKISYTLSSAHAQHQSETTLTTGLSKSTSDEKSTISSGPFRLTNTRARAYNNRCDASQPLWTPHPSPHPHPPCLPFRDLVI